MGSSKDIELIGDQLEELDKLWKELYEEEKEESHDLILWNGSMLPKEFHTFNLSREEIHAFYE